MKHFPIPIIALLAMLLTVSRGASPTNPNIIFVLADDLGWTDTATYGSKYYETPNIDRLASQGLKLTRYHNCQNCQPTQAALMTGQYGARIHAPMPTKNTDIKPASEGKASKRKARKTAE